MLCNALVCLAVWLTYGAHTTTDKILAIVPPIAAFVAAGFEHSVANMYFIPIALLIKTDDAFVASLDPQPDLSSLTWSNFFADNCCRSRSATSSAARSWSAPCTGSSTCGGNRPKADDGTRTHDLLHGKEAGEATAGIEDGTKAHAERDSVRGRIADDAPRRGTMLTKKLT